MPGFLHRNDRRGEYPESYYAASVSPARPLLPWKGDGQCDICIIGGGYTGLSSALHLAQAGYNVLVLDAHRMGWGASGRNGGQVGTGQRLDQIELESIVSLADAHRLWTLAQDAKALVFKLIAEHQIECDLTYGYIHADHRARFGPETRAHVEHLQRHYNYDKVRVLDSDEIQERIGSPYYFGGYEDSGAAHLHPLNYALGLARAASRAGAELFERSEVTRIETGRRPRVHVNGGCITADYVIVACNGYLDGILPPHARQVMPINNYILATEPLGDERARSLIANNECVSDSRFVINYFRLSADRRLLFGGGETYGSKFPDDIKAFVKRPMLEVFPQLEDVQIDYGWGGTLAITMRRLPSFMRVSPSVYSVAGYSGHGVALATLAGRILCDAIRGQAENFDLMGKLPTPSFPGGTLLRWPLLTMAMLYYAMRDRL